jgi:glycoside/pentoside/hexuronide:cation symporter, GPH family
MTSASQKLSVMEKVGYSLGDAAANFIFTTMLIFLTIFYTDVFGIPAAAVGTLFLVARITDAGWDFAMGAIADRTNTRWGKFRPWVLWTAVPFGILGVLTFSTPDLSVHGKIIWAYVTYISLMIVYSANNIPYSALTGVLTGDNVERTSLASYRFVAVMVAQMAIQGFVVPLNKAFGHGDPAKGYQSTMIFFCTLGVIFFIVTFFTTKERVQPDPRQKTSIGQDIKDLAHNGPWVALFALTILVFLYLSVRGAVTAYYFQYYVTRHDTFGLNLLGLQLDFDYFSLFNMSGLAASIVGIGFSKPLAVRYGKRNAFIGGVVGTALFMVGFYWLGPDAIGAMFVTQILLQFAWGTTIPLLWAMMGDVADYSEWLTGRRATGIAFAATVFGLKFGLGVGGALAGWLLSVSGYVANAVQSESALRGIRMMMSVIPAGFLLLGLVALLLYKIDLATERKMDVELQERRKAFEPASA